MGHANDELVAVFPSKILDQIGKFEGLTFNTQKYLNTIFNNNFCFLRRSDAETNASYKQLVSYIIIRTQSTIFSFRRSRHGQEKRLSEMFSLGIGGHIRKDDIDPKSPIFTRGLIRELEEEVTIYPPYKGKTIALINDETDDVGKVHFGIVHVISLKKPDILIKDNAITDGHFIELKDLRKNIHIYENWSKICILQIEMLCELDSQT